MTRAVPPTRKSAVCAGAVGLAVFGVAPAAHADASGAVSHASMINLRSLLSGDAARLGLDQLPVVGEVPDMLSNMPVNAMPTVVPMVMKSPGARMRPIHTDGLGLLPLASNLPLDREKAEGLLQAVTGGDITDFGPLGTLTRGLSGAAAF